MEKEKRNQGVLSGIKESRLESGELESEVNRGLNSLFDFRLTLRSRSVRQRRDQAEAVTAEDAENGHMTNTGISSKCLR